jgi:hypothetical protein
MCVPGSLSGQYWPLNWPDIGQSLATQDFEQAPGRSRPGGLTLARPGSQAAALRFTPLSLCANADASLESQPQM